MMDNFVLDMTPVKSQNNTKWAVDKFTKFQDPSAEIVGI